MITEAEVAEWKIDPVTKAFMESMQERENDVTYRLTINRDEDVRDEFLKGYITAVRDVQNFDFEVDQ